MNMVDEKQSEEIVEKELETQKVADRPSDDTPFSGSNMIADLNKAVDRAEAANKVTAELLKRQEEIRVQDVLGGKSDASKIELSAEEIAKRNAKKMLEGTGFEDELFPDN